MADDSVVNPDSGAKFSKAHETHGPQPGKGSVGPQSAVPDKHRSLPPLIEDIQQIHADRSRMDKAIDFLLGIVCDRIENHAREFVAEAVHDTASDLVWILEATRHRPNLPNRQRLLELVEAAMPKEKTRG